MVYYKIENILEKTSESSPVDVERDAIIRTGSIAEQTHFVKKKNSMKTSNYFKKNM